MNTISFLLLKIENIPFFNKNQVLCDDMQFKLHCVMCLKSRDHSYLANVNPQFRHDVCYESISRKNTT